MIAPIYPVCAASAAVQAVLGSPPSLWPFGEVPEGTTYPYAVWQSIGGGPENYINQTPDMDSYSLQVDVYGNTSESVTDVAHALRDAIEPHAHITSWLGQSKDPETKRYRYTFSVDWFARR
ncbi:MAG: hypothetical protein CMK74_12180 [Pseudomonadales bacterium]|nr:hypothetical protein [Pseudomonadales bacterium]